MKKREDIVQKFSTFLSLGDNKSSRRQNLIWQADSRLERHMKQLAQLEPEAKEEFWSRHFLKIVRDASQAEKIGGLANGENRGIQRYGDTLNFSASANVNPMPLATLREAAQKTSTMEETPIPVTYTEKPSCSVSSAMQWLLNSQEANTRLVPVGVTASSSMARNHLSAYLQEACFWAAQKTYQRFKLLQYKYSIEEYFQIANSGVNPPEKIFKSFDFEYSHTNIEGYAKTAIFRFINNTIYRHDLEAKRVKFSDYGLLKDLSHKELREALISKGITQAKSDTYYLVWQCFDEIYQPNQSQGSRSLEPPSQKHLKQIADYYNQRLNKIEISAVPASEEKIKEMLETCIQAARDYRTKRFIPLDNSDYMSDSTPTLWDTAIQEEEREQVQSLIARLFEEIPETGQILLKLSQGLNLTQIEIANVLKNKFPELQKQYQVARQLGKYNNTFLKNFINEWNKIDPEIRLSDERDIERIKNSLSECLQSHCQKMFYTTLDRTVKQYAHEKKNLVSRDGAKLNEETIPQMLQLAVGEIYSRPAEVKQYLATVFRQELKNSMSIATDSLQLVSHKIVVFVDEWLQKSSININEYGKEYGT